MFEIFQVNELRVIAYKVYLCRCASDRIRKVSTQVDITEHSQTYFLIIRIEQMFFFHVVQSLCKLPKDFFFSLADQFPSLLWYYAVPYFIVSSILHIALTINVREQLTQAITNKPTWGIWQSHKPLKERG